MDYLEREGARLPVLGLGTWDMRGVECRRAVLTALEVGYRSIDTAAFYMNEAEIGQAIRESFVSREELFLTTKVWHTHLRREDCIRSLEDSLKQLGTEYVDLFLIHWPNDAVPLAETLRAMNDLVHQGKTRSIGVSNFSIDLLEAAQSLSPTPILTNQVEYHPFHSPAALLDYCRKAQVIVSAYSPLARGRVLHHPLLREIAERYGKTPAQITLRWLIQQKGVMAIPKATRRDHQEKNFDIFDFRLTDGEMADIGSLKT
ncbi:MAG TPA: aldo/keto reductase [Atribacteraceae bacterium]|nr:aldo/keto reductase [Atribacteraceae bacterium]